MRTPSAVAALLVWQFAWVIGCPIALGQLRQPEPDKAESLGQHERMADRRRSSPAVGSLATCFADGTSDVVIETFRHASARFNNNSRWGPTSYTPAGSAFGQPLTISYSIIPDGTQVSGFNGEPDAPSNLRAVLAGIYGSESAWLAHVHSAFNRWGQVCGVKYVYEPNDDGAEFAGALGVPGVRGDCRIGGHRIDGNGNVLAYNFYPEPGDSGFGGDMVIDTSDNFFNNLAGNSVLLRNVLGHEHGHGLGMNHVCPIQGSRLMEPIIATNFDGPRQDEVRQAQYLYGDLFEPNDDALHAADLGVLSECLPLAIGDQSVVSPLNPTALNSIPFCSPASLGAFGDVDFFFFTIETPRRVDIRVSPAGHPYDNSTQGCAEQASCCSGEIDDSEQQWDLAFDLIGPDATTVVATANGTPLGGGEFANDVLLTAPGTYFLRVRGSALRFGSQMYSLEITPRPAALLAEVLDGRDLALPPGPSVAIDIRCDPGMEHLDLGQSRLFLRRSAAGDFVPVPLNPKPDGDFRAVLFDVPCGALLNYYVELKGSGGTTVRLPCASIYSPHVGTRTEVLKDDFEIDRGWMVGADTATSGNWVRAIPVGTQAQPTHDHSLVGTRCFVTGNGPPGEAPGGNDVDGGYTQLVSPLLNLAAFSDVEVSYWRWFSNSTSSGAYVDTAQFDVNASNTSPFFWRRAETIGPGSATDTDVNGGWRFHSFRFSSIPVVPSATTRLRYYVIDGLEPSIVEGAIDDVTVVGLSCNSANTCVGDLDSSHTVDDSDFVLFVGAYNELLCPLAPFDSPCPGDFNLDHQVDDADFLFFVAAYDRLVCP